MAGTMIARTASGPPQRTQLPSQELLDDLCSRFVLNVPEEELQAFERILFSVEQAHWFYEDNAMEQNMALKSLTLREFTSLMFQSCTALRPYITQIDDIYKDFTTYKTRVPVMGAIILDETLERCLLVKGWKAGASWSFPRGKKNKGEEDHSCATREVLEETGYDIHPKLKLEDHLEVVMGQQRMRLYIIPGVKDDTMFAPQTKKEVSEIAWHRVDELPMVNGESAVHHRGPTGQKYFMVFPFVTPLKNWIAKKRPQYARRGIPLPGVSIWKVKNNLSSGGSGPLSQNYVNAVMPAAPAAVAAPVPSSEKIKNTPKNSPKQSPKHSPKQSPKNSPRIAPRVIPKTPPPQTPPKPVLKGPPGVRTTKRTWRGWRRGIVGMLMKQTHPIQRHRVKQIFIKPSMITWVVNTAMGVYVEAWPPIDALMVEKAHSSRRSSVSYISFLALPYKSSLSTRGDT